MIRKNGSFSFSHPLTSESGWRVCPFTGIGGIALSPSTLSRKTACAFLPDLPADRFQAGIRPGSRKGAVQLRERLLLQWALTSLVAFDGEEHGICLVNRQGGVQLVPCSISLPACQGARARSKGLWGPPGTSKGGKGGG